MYRDLLAQGHDCERARDAVLQQWGEFLNDVDAGPVIWLALADTQWKRGQLDEGTRARALDLIDNGAALQPWKEDPRILRKRREVLTRVRDRLSSPQPFPRKVRARFRDSCDWKRGELIAYRLSSGRTVVFRVVGHHTDRGGTSPVVEVLDWTGDRLPSAKELEKCSIRPGIIVEGIGPIPASAITQIFIGRVSSGELPKDRVQRLGIVSTPTQEVRGFGGACWRNLDARLFSFFGLR